MTHLSKQQKLEAYTYCWLMTKGFLRHHLENFCCNTLANYMDRLGVFVRYEDVMQYFPELAKQRPIGARKDRGWWKKDADRIRAIERAIELTEKLND